MNQEQIENLTSAFSRGFILSREAHEAPENFVAGPVLKHFSVHPLLQVNQAQNGPYFVVVLGLAFHESADEVTSVPGILLNALFESEEEFFSELRHVSGRYVVIYGGPGFLRVVSDATATRSVFYADNGDVVSSHPQLAARYLGTEDNRDPLPFMNGFPGNFTPYRGVKLLTANLVCELWGGSIRRYWPSRKIEQLSAEDAAERAFSIAVSNIQKASEVSPLKLALTAGIDSRVVFGCAMKAGVDFDTFTYGSPSGAERIDHRVAKHLAGEFKQTHRSVRPSALIESAEANILEASFTNNHVAAIGGLQQFFESPRTIGLNGNLLELARDHYMTTREYEKEYFGGKLYAMIYYRKLSQRFKKNLSNSISRDKYIHTVEQYFNEWLSQIGGFVGGYFPPVSQFYWEHRMAAWNGPFTIERDFYSDFLVPFNSHKIFELFLSVPETDRYERKIHLSMLRLANPRLIDVPINPKAWPPKAP